MGDPLKHLKPKRQLTEAQRKALRPPWKPGEAPGTRISNDAAAAIRLARRYCPEAVQYAYNVMNSAAESTTLRLKACDILLEHGMPRGDNSRYVNEETIGAITISIVRPEPAAKPVIDAVPLTVYTPTEGSGD